MRDADASSSYDVVVIGAGPVGATTALACAQRGQRVLVLEQDPSAVLDQCVGEWLHPPALEVLDALGVDLSSPVSYPTGRGFVVHPEDGSEPIVLPYQAPRSGLAVPRGVLVETLRGYVDRHGSIDYLPGARAARLEDDALTYEHGGAARTVRAERFALATGGGPRPAARGETRIFAATGPRAPVHRICGLTLRDATLPFEGFLSLFVGGPGPAFAYRIGPGQVRLLLDVPLRLAVPRTGGVELFEAYAAALPESLHGPMADAIRSGAIAWRQGQLRPRHRLAEGRLLFAGDAAGSVHPMMGAGLGLGLADAAAIARLESPSAYARARWRASRIPETVAVGLSELLSDPSPEAVALRQSVYRFWREHSKERLRTMGFVMGEGAGAARFASSCLRVMLHGASRVTRRRSLSRRADDTGRRMVSRIGWMVAGGLGWTEALPRRLEARLEAEAGAAARFGSAIRGHDSRGEVVGLPHHKRRDAVTLEALRGSVDALLEEQAPDGSFEGEVVWCPMLAAQYVLACHAMGHPIEPTRARRLLLHFARTELPGGAWGLHEKSEPYLFVTALVYVASRLLGVEKGDSRLRRARAFIRDEGGAVGIPSWGKLWLALVGLYDWEGVSPVAPELWSLPRELPIHPSRYYCHTRLIYLGMATLYGERFVGPVTPTIRALRDELFVTPYDEIRFAAARRTLRQAEIHQPPSRALEASYAALSTIERFRNREQRGPLLDELRERIRYELRSTSHTCISPVSGLLDILALHSADPDDRDVAIALERFDGWMWEDDVDGTRVTGARSASWDTAFAAQALAHAAPFFDLTDALERADTFLASQQIRVGTGDEPANDRLDPTGGYCFAGVWHGWPVSDCTAEAVLARLESPGAAPDPAAIESAVRFILQTRNVDGGFGSYEARRVEVPIDWLNPSEMFGACMTERSYVECTASCVAALAAYRDRFVVDEPLRSEVDEAITAGVRSLREAQRADGSWAGMWGVHFIYGTMFGIRGLIAGGVRRTDPQIRRACAFLEERQRPDGAWGEHFSSVLEDRYVEHAEGQVVQTAWAMCALLEAGHPDFAPLERAAAFLARTQNEDGTWDKQDPEGIFFHTALLEYALYRRYFPLWALGLYQARAVERSRIAARLEEATPARVGPRA